MKTGKVADMLGVDQKTILNWVDRSGLREVLLGRCTWEGQVDGAKF